MEIIEARELAEGLMRAHGLTGWRLVFDRARTRAGVCRNDRHEIGLSQVLTALHPIELVRGTILHEIAHALVGSRHGHDAVWQVRARSIGGDGERCLRADAPRPDAPWVGVCARGHEVLRHRRPARPSSCSRCSPSFDVAHLLAWRLHGRRVLLPSGYLAELATMGTASGQAGRTAARRVGTAAAPANGAPSDAWLAPGTTVVLGGFGRYAGLTGYIEKRGRTRYHVRTVFGTVAAPFALVRSTAGRARPARPTDG